MGISRRTTVVVTAAVAFALVAVTWWALGRPLGVDSAVYRAGGIAVLRGEPLYGHLSALPAWAPELPFTYPPFAALLFTPFAALPVQWCWGLVAMAAAPALAVALRPYAPGAGALLAAFALQPVWQTIGLGQLNLVLMALVVVDVLRRRGSAGGVLIGLAAAIKLIPLIFVVHLLLTGRRADAARALGTFAGATALGAVLLPADSVRYWTSALFNDHFARMKGWVGNQSWAGFADRTAPGQAWLLAAVALIVAGAVVVVRWRWLAGDERGALLVTAGCALLVSPISWTHHWVWVGPALGYLLTTGRRWSALVLAVLFTGWTVAVVPGGQGRERDWTAGQALVGNAYLLVAVVAGVVLVVAAIRRSRRVGPAPGVAHGYGVNEPR
ncbi:glycosyltransferase 87 family protein [Amycolatopsis sp. OK19-0408]|uniref:Glycosyltransferase 87 family protein n=1 Tax=Amycolatopsis iheyensis TaxID=2945988 RepID=A0A9X2SPI8_9PSEU|nr:glycosyltransferase 87 family protein [Amycolatopsis iheyensis]MCR6488918.1 glycosyltransferase 87 family protein [Amycolatopsis iheyensis]